MSKTTNVDRSRGVREAHHAPVPVVTVALIARKHSRAFTTSTLVDRHRPSLIAYNLRAALLGSVARTDNIRAPHLSATFSAEHERSNRTLSTEHDAGSLLDSMTTAARNSGASKTKDTRSVLARVGKLFKSWLRREPEPAPLLINEDTESETETQEEDRRGRSEVRWADKLGWKKKKTGL
ncbi:hypothetical protein EG328_006467 [Venturia inaequalis]|uniref:Uncharacterized protein n=1 Tax=Venturia inaequalis TaxID=5025 RepID=A0A8H3UGA2_VENIN|nr:hypothetical protein EG328_006467 [Venturia inaequalis]RDI85742.1 hypothetical protein Vi05172_g4535 [Venturia inaequalis]